MRPHIVLFARSPHPGRVKTRLAPAIGAAAAARIHAALLRHAIDEIAGSGLPATLCSDAPIEFAPPWPWQAQQGHDLGERMWRAIREAAARGAAPILIGSDCPGIDANYLAAAANALARGADLVLGPAEDGGYGLIAGPGALPRGLFEGIAWGGRDVLAETRARAAACGLTVRLMDAIWDVDRPGDLARLAHNHPGIVRAAGLNPDELKTLRG